LVVLEAKEDVNVGQIRCTDEFKIDAVAQVTERGYSVKDVADRPGDQHQISVHLDGTILRATARD